MWTSCPTGCGSGKANRAGPVLESTLLYYLIPKLERLQMIRKAGYVAIFGLVVAVIGILTLRERLAIGPIVFLLAAVPLAGLWLGRRSIKGALPDLIFGALDTGLLTIPALWGGVQFGVAGAIAGGVVGDALTDGIAGFFEGGIAQWLRSKGIEESREPVTTSLGKMAGCLLGSGLVLTVALLAGIAPEFARL